MLTDQQDKLWHVIAAYLETNGRIPSFEEMKQALGLKSKSGIHRLVAALVEKGVVKRNPNRWRGLELLRTPPDASLCKARLSHRGLVIEFGSSCRPEERGTILHDLQTAIAAYKEELRG